MKIGVLVVDDSQITRSVLRRSLIMNGVDESGIEEASNAMEALGKMNAGCFDIVFTDLHMPQSNGYELLENRSKDPLLQSIPVVVVSTEGHSEQRARVDELGATAFLRKPVRPEELRETLQNILGVTL